VKESKGDPTATKTATNKTGAVVKKKKEKTEAAK